MQGSISSGAGCSLRLPSRLRFTLDPSRKWVALRTHTIMRSSADAQMQEALKKAMQDPQMAAQLKAYQEALSKPGAQQQLQQMTSYMQNQQVQQRMAQLKDDPEFAHVFQDIQKNGMGALMKYYNDPDFLAKLGSKLGDIQPTAGAPGPAAAMGAPPAPEVLNLRDAAKYGDVEAIEDFLAIGKDVNEGDKEGRTALHYAAAYGHTEIASILIDAGANLAATDRMTNTPLHYAAGYGQPASVGVLLKAGADTKAKNDSGKTAAELVTIEPRNPLNADQALLQKLSA